VDYSLKLEIKIFISAEEVASKIAEELMDMVSENSGEGRNIAISLSGGSTPKILFEKISIGYADRIDWNKVHLFWGDERCVPSGDEQSNYGMTKKYLLDNIKIPDTNVHRIRGETDPAKEAARIADEIRKILPVVNDLPRFDLNILGLGEDGHTASLFPGKKLKTIADGIAGVAVHPGSGQKRISLTRELLSNAGQNIFMVTGEKKADIVYKIMSSKNSVKKFPAAEIRAADILKWYLDESAASKIKPT
jgi:6-phosphogluconolactonase